MNLSASCIKCFKACPMRFYYQYVLGLVPITEPDAFRMGTNYHKIQEIASMKPGSECECISRGPQHIAECEICENTGFIPDDPMDAVIRHLDKQYTTPPAHKTVEEWETERTILLYSLVGYKWWYEDAGYEVEHLEQRFNMPLLSPITGHPVRANLKGVIDRMFSAGSIRERADGQCFNSTNRFVHEYKSSSMSLDPDSDIWGKLTLDTQTRLYTYAAKRLDLGMCGVLYDIWRKPSIRPKKITQGESKKFALDGMYCGESFNVSMGLRGQGSDRGPTYQVNGREAEVTPGAKEGTFAIRETPEMYGARLLQDITVRPEHYFARKEIAHHQSNIDAFQWDLYHIYKTICDMNNNNRWWHDESQCDATFKCAYTCFCYTHTTISEDGVPDGFKKIPTSVKPRE